MTDFCASLESGQTSQGGRCRPSETHAASGDPKEALMPALVKRTLVLTLLLTLAAIAFGSSRSTQPLNSPYASALHHYAVGTAVAKKPNQCTNTGCLTLQGINSCRGGEYPGTNCVLVNRQCQVTTCP